MTLAPDLLHVLESEIRDPEARARVAHAIGLAKSMHQRERVRAALQLMHAGRCRADIKSVLMQRFCISRASAYRVICEALNERQGFNAGL